VRFVTAQSGWSQRCAVTNRTYQNHHTLFVLSPKAPRLHNLYLNYAALALWILTFVDKVYKSVARSLFV